MKRIRKYVFLFILIISTGSVFAQIDRQKLQAVEELKQEMLQIFDSTKVNKFASHGMVNFYYNLTAGDEWYALYFSDRGVTNLILIRETENWVEINTDCSTHKQSRDLSLKKKKGRFLDYNETQTDVNAIPEAWQILEHYKKLNK